MIINILWAFIILIPALLNVDLSGWWSYPLESSLWIILTAPLHFWLSYHFLIPASAQIEGQDNKGISSFWKIILLTVSFLVAVGSVFLVVKIYTEYPWKLVVELFFRFNSG
jgi:hypothetical protein